MRAVRFAVVLTAVLTCAAPGADYFPLKEGNQWSYAMSTGVEMTVAVVGYAQVGAVRCAVVETRMGWQTQREYMATDAEGVKTYMAQAQGQEMRYDPPVLRIKLPVQEGQTWTSTTSQFGMSITTTNRWLGAERVQTPAGTFDCVRVQSTVTVPGQAPMVSISHYADGIGGVRQAMQVGGQEITAVLTSTNVRPTQTPAPASTPTEPIEVAGKTRCPQCGAMAKAGAKFCPACGAGLAQAAPVTACPQCGAKLPAGARFCPECGNRIASPAPIPQTNEQGPPTMQAGPDLERYESPDGKVLLYKPRDWTVNQEPLGEGAFGLSLMDPAEKAAVMFMTFPTDEEIKDSVVLAAKCLTAIAAEIPTLKVASINSTPERERTIAEITLIDEGEKGIGRGYFFHTQRTGTVYILLAREDLWDEVRPTLIAVAANLAFAPEGMAAVQERGRQFATQAPAPQGGQVLSPAAMIQQASRRAGRQVPLRPAALPDQSMALQIPQGWSLQGQKVQFTTFDNPQTKQRGVGSGSHTVIPTQFPVPGTINASYQPPLQALGLVLQLGQVGTDLQLLGECPTEQAIPEAADSIRQFQAQGMQVDARLMHVRFRSLATGATLRGLFAVQCIAIPMSPVWQVLADGSWAPDNEYDEWLPLYLQIIKSTQVNQQWFGGEMQNRYARQQQLNRNLQNSIAESNQAFDQYMNSLRDADRSRDYTSYMWSQTTLGQGTWVAENEGARVYRTDSWGLEGPEGRIDHAAFNTTNFTGQEPWGGTQLEMVDTRAEYERHIANR